MNVITDCSPWLYMLGLKTEFDQLPKKWPGNVPAVTDSPKPKTLLLGHFKEAKTDFLLPAVSKKRNYRVTPLNPNAARYCEILAGTYTFSISIIDKKYEKTEYFLTNQVPV